MTTEQYENLPAYARDEINILRARNRELTAQLSPVECSRVWSGISYMGMPDVEFLREKSPINFALEADAPWMSEHGELCRKPNTVDLDVKLLDDRTGISVRLNSVVATASMIVQPRTTNEIFIRYVDERKIGVLPR